MDGNKLIIFLKAPRPGEVKTRLAASLGAQEAAEAYSILVSALVRQLTSLAHVELRYSPDGAEGEINLWLQPDWIARAQGCGDLGQRLQRAFTESFASGSKRVVIIGSDCPTVTTQDIRRAWQELREHDLVLGPATDGGYWLIGLRGNQPAFFENIAWSTANVFHQTIQRAESNGLKACLLGERTDIDTLDEWQAFVRQGTAK